MQMVDVENLWIVVAIDPGAVEEMVDLLSGPGEADEEMNGIPVNIVGVIASSKEVLLHQMAVDYPHMETIGYWRLGDLLGESVDKLTAT